MDKDEEVMTGLMELINKWGWVNKQKMETSLKSFKSAEVHYIEYIAKNADSNLTKFADSFYMTRGAVSKIIRKLADKGLVESYQIPDNRKEIYFKLTRQGKAIYRIHEKLHKEFKDRDKTVFEQMNDEQFENIFNFLDKYNRHLDMEIKKLNFDRNRE